MTHEKLKTALREAFDDVHMIHSPKFLEFLAGALARRGVIVATAADSHISSKEVWDSWRDKVKSILARAVPYPARYGMANEIMHLLFPTPTDGVHNNFSQPTSGETTALGLTDEEIGREMLRIYDKSISSEHRGANGHYAQMGRRARELLQPCNGAVQVSDDGKTVAPICDLKVRLEKAEAALERVRATFEGWLHPAATSEGGKHVDTILWEVAREAGLRIIPAEPAKPLRVEVAK
jgi:hypothetical protein